MGVREGWRDTPAGGARKGHGGWPGTCRQGRQRLVEGELLGWVIGLNSPVYLMTLDRLKERS